AIRREPPVDVLDDRRVGSHERRGGGIPAGCDDPAAPVAREDEPAGMETDPHDVGAGWRRHGPPVASLFRQACEVELPSPKAKQQVTAALQPLRKDVRVPVLGAVWFRELYRSPAVDTDA